MLAAFALPVLAGLYLSGMLSAEFFASPTWSVLYTSFGQLSNLLSLPIWIVSFTLLYFDSRVRKEAYDLDLIAREINPGFYWEPPARPGPFGYQVSTSPASNRSPVQTSPLGLAGYNPRPEPGSASTAGPQPNVADRSPDEFHVEDPNRGSESGEVTTVSEQTRSQTCGTCGAVLLPEASFCMNCGSLTS